MATTATDRIPVEIDAQMTPAVRAFVLALYDQIDSLKTRVSELESEISRLKKTPRNSSKPPSSEHPHAKPVAQRKKKRRKRGGQKGHPRHDRPLIDTDQCDRVVPLTPDACRRCGQRLSGIDPVPLRHQVWELPQIKPVVTEYQRHRLTCPCCQTTTCAELPPGVPQGQAGPRLVAFVSLLMAYFRQSKRRTALFLETLLNIPCCPAWTVKLQRQATEALRPTWQILAEALPKQPHVGGDETPTKEADVKSWLWTFVAAKFTVFTIRSSRAATAITDMLGQAFAGVVSCDRAKMYWAVARRQWCWAHLKRDFQALVDHWDPQVERLGRDLLRPTRKLFRHWARYRDGTLSWNGLKRNMGPIRKEIEALLLRGEFSANARLVGMCRELHSHRESLWTYLQHEGMEPTNNASERALRHAVIWRKLSFGTQSASGSRFVETLLTVIETCRQQKRNVFQFVTDAVQAHFAGENASSLLATP